MKPLSLADIQLSGLNLIEASAGTGKTWTIAALYLRLVLERELRPESILVVTYTKAATAELRDRIRHRLATTLELFGSGNKGRDELEELLLKRCRNRGHGVRLLTRALYSFDDAAIFTIHGFCQRALSENAFESGSLFDTEMTADQSALVQEAADDYWRSAILARQDAFLERLVAEGYTPETVLQPFAGRYQSPGIRIVPGTGETDYNSAAAPRDTIFRQAATIWQAERDTLVALLKRPGLNQNSYRPDRVDAAAAQLDLWLGGPPAEACNKLALFTSDNLKARTTKGKEPPQHPFFELCQRLLAACTAADDAFAREWTNSLIRFHRWLGEELPRRKRQRNLRGYDDLLLDLHRALEGSGGGQLAARLRERYQAALIDEFQDTDPVQWRIFGRLADLDTKPAAGAGRGGEVNTVPRQETAAYPLFLIGDPKQAIYSFRGADVFAYLEAARGVAGERRWTLGTNRRSTARLVDAVNGLFAVDDPFLCRDIGHAPVTAGRDPRELLLVEGRPDDAPLRFWVYPSSGEKQPAKAEVRAPIAAAVAAEIARLLAGPCRIRSAGTERPLLPGNLAVLVRTHTQADLVQQALTSLGIPSAQHGNASVFDSPEALDLLRFLRAAAAPYREALVTEALLGGSAGLSADQVAAARGDSEAWEGWLERFHGLRQAYAEGGIMALLTALLGTCGMRERLLRLPDGERRLTNLLHGAELLHQATREGDNAIESAIVWLERRITGSSADEAALLRLESDDNAVTIATIHASKGLQYPLVFLPYAWDVPGKDPDPVVFHDAGAGLTLDLGSGDLEGHRALARRERDAEAARLLYVALTRAEFRCWVVWGAISQADASPLFRLIHGPAAPPLKELDDDVLEALRAVQERAPGVHAEPMPSPLPPPGMQPSEAATAPLRCRTFAAAIPADWRVASFTSLAGAGERHLQPRDYDAQAGAPLPDTAGEEMSGRGGIFDFPRGAAAGTCLHEIFERLDFARLEPVTIEQVTAERLRANGYDHGWLPAVSSMVANVTRVALIPDAPAFSLSSLQPGAWQVEMEFFLPVRHLSPELLYSMFDGLLDTERHGDFGRVLSGLAFRQSRGMLQGFMDMVFEHGGRWYIIDWKSNHLGNRREDYGAAGLGAAMAQHAYILQYHLYTLALDRLLRLRLPGYSYEAHFGGAIYVFLRGVGCGGENHGIYRDRPDEEFMRRANRLLLAGTAAAERFLE